MAITPRDNEAFYREVDEEVRRDQLKSYWERYGKAGIALVILLIGALAAFFWWQHRQQEAAGKQAAELSSAFEDIAARNKASAAAKLDRLAKSDSPGFRASALMTKADLAIESGDFKGAIALFRQAADDQKLAQPYREAATIRLTALEFDGLAPQAAIDRLKPYTLTGNPWFGSAGEMTAMAYLKLNKPRDAARIFAAMAKDEKVPESIRTRAVEMAGSLGVNAMPDAAAPIGDVRQ